MKNIAICYLKKKKILYKYTHKCKLSKELYSGKEIMTNVVKICIICFPFLNVHQYEKFEVLQSLSTHRPEL